VYARSVSVGVHSHPEHAAASVTAVTSPAARGPAFHASRHFDVGFNVSWRSHELLRRYELRSLLFLVVG
jgi:hypothetical protein